jgi:hypothetical protein
VATLACATAPVPTLLLGILAPTAVLIPVTRSPDSASEIGTSAALYACGLLEPALLAARLSVREVPPPAPEPAPPPI